MVEVDPDYKDKLVFLAEWFDYERSHRKNFYVTYYPYDNTVEVYDKDKNRMYLRRAVCEGVSLKDMFVGSTIRIYGRQMYINNYGDLHTKKVVSKKNEKTLAIFKPSVVKDFGAIVNIVLEKKFKFLRLKMYDLVRAEALAFYESRKGDPFLPFLIEQLVLGPIIVANIVGEDAIERWRTVMGPKDPAVARSQAPDSLRAIYGLELASNGFHGSDSPEYAESESNFFFPKPSKNKKVPNFNLSLKNTTCCVIKPHALEAGHLGNIINEIRNNSFKILTMEMFYLSNANVDEFLEVYKGVVSDFRALMLSFIDGPCLAMEIGANDDCDAHADFRKFAGPSDPDIARQIRPNTLRAKFGVDKYRNAVHCTDLPDDTALELEFFFKIMQD